MCGNAFHHAPVFSHFQHTQPEYHADFSTGLLFPAQGKRSEGIATSGPPGVSAAAATWRAEAVVHGHGSVLRVCAPEIRQPPRWWSPGRLNHTGCGLVAHRPDRLAILLGGESPAEQGPGLALPQGPSFLRPAVSQRAGSVLWDISPRQKHA